MATSVTVLPTVATRAIGDSTYFALQTKWLRTTSKNCVWHISRLLSRNASSHMMPSVNTFPQYPFHLLLLVAAANIHSYIGCVSTQNIFKCIGDTLSLASIGFDL